MATVRVRGNNFDLVLLAHTLPQVNHLISEYLNDQNCWPDCWIDGESLTETEKATFVYYTLTNPSYKYNPFK